MLCILRQEPDIKKFEEYLKSFLLLLSKDSDLEAFATYFRDNYNNRCSVWATCYRLGSTINTNMYLESMHKVLKYIYLKGVTCKRLDKTIHVLLNYVRDKQFQRVIKLEKGKVTHKISKINQSHLTALKSEMFVVEKDNNWEIQSLGKTYFVKINKLDKHECKLLCSTYVSCVHYYTCTCMDYVIYANMCKHIHKVCMSIINRSSKEQKYVADTISKEEIEDHLDTLRRPNLEVLQGKIKENIHSLLLSNVNSVQNPDALKKANSYLISALSILNSAQESSFDNKENSKVCPANKKIEGQNRFVSTKKKRLTVPRLGKPSLKEKEELTKKLENVSTHSTQ